MKSYKVQVKLKNGSVTTITIQARSMADAREIGKVYGQVIIVYNG